MLQELQRFSTDERGIGGTIELIVMAGIAIVLAVTLYKGVIGGELAEAAQTIVCWIKCALNPACTGC